MAENICDQIEWPYQIEWDKHEEVEIDVLVLGGGIAGCWAALSAVKKGVSVAIVEKGATIKSGAGGSGCDHWESAATNPCSGVTPEELTEAMIKDHGLDDYLQQRLLMINSYLDSLFVSEQTALTDFLDL